MIYRGGFYSVNDIDYTVEIETKENSGVTEITLGGSPFITQMDSSDQIIYTPVKGSGATIEIVTENAIFDLYSDAPLNTKVRLIDTKTGNIIWCGFLTPCMYNQNYEVCNETLELEAIDGLSVLQNVKWSKVQKNEEMTFAQIIDQCIAIPGCFKNWYVSDNIGIEGVSSSKNVTELMKVYDSNFYDDQGEEALTDYDRAWMAWDVLEEVCKFLGMTAVARGEEVFILDYDAIRRGRNSYHKFTVGNPGSSTLITDISYNFNVTGNDVGGSGTQLSLDAIYDSVKVKDEFHKVDTNADAGKEKNITYADREWMQSQFTYKQFGLRAADGFESTSMNGENTTFQTTMQSIWQGDYIGGIWKFINSPKFKLYNYRNDNTRALVDLSERCSFRDMMTHSGAYLVDFCTKKKDNHQVSQYRTDWPDSELLKLWNTWMGLQCKTVPLDRMIILSNKRTEQGHIGPGKRLRTGLWSRIYPDDLANDPEDAMFYPFLEYRDNSAFYFSGEASNLLIKGEVLIHDQDNSPYPMYSGSKNKTLKYKKDKKIKCEFYLHAKLQIGDWFWNGEEWTQKDSFFRLYYMDECNKTTNKDTRQNQSFWDKFYKFQNLSKLKWDYTEEAYWVPAPAPDVIGGEMVFTLFANKDMWGQSNHNQWAEGKSWDNNRYMRYLSSVICIKNFELKAQISNGKLDDRDIDSDTVYTNIIEGPSVNPLDEITFKICTDDSKSINYSSVTYVTGGSKQFLKGVINKVLDSEIKKSSTSAHGGTTLCAEEMLIYRICNQYEKPRKMYDYTLQGVDYSIFGLYTDNVIQDCSFIASEINFDYRMETTTIKLIEKV